MVTALQQYLHGIPCWGLAALLGFSGPGLSPAAAQSEVNEAQAQQELEDLRARIEATQERLAAERSERSDAEKRIESLDREIARRAGEIRHTEEALETSRAEIMELDERLAELRKRLAGQKDAVSQLAYSAYVMGRQSQLKLFLNQEDTAVINRMLGYHDYIIDARARTIEEIDGWTTELAALAKEQADRREALESLAATYRSEQQNLQARREEREIALAALDAKIVSSKDELSRLQENENQLKQLLNELGRYGARSSRQVAEGAFQGMQGHLRLPVSAPIAARYGELRTTGVRWDGIMFRPENGDEVSAIFEGRVVFADWLRGFGLLLIIDHGDGYMSLYSHNESLFKQLGDWVDTGETIATVGTSGGLDRPGLYFEIRQNGEPQNPLSWCERA